MFSKTILSMTLLASGALASYGTEPEVFRPPFHNQDWVLNLRLVRTLKFDFKKNADGILSLGECKFIVADRMRIAKGPSEYVSAGYVYPGDTHVLEASAATYGDFRYELGAVDHFDARLDHTAIAYFMRGNTVLTTCRSGALIRTGYFEAMETPVRRRVRDGQIVGDMPTRQMPQLLTTHVEAVSNELKLAVEDLEREFAEDPDMRFMDGFRVSNLPGSEEAGDLAAGKLRHRD